MRIQLFLIGVVAALSLGALTLADAVPTGNTSTALQNVGPSPIRSASPSPTPTVQASPSESPVPAEVAATPEPTPSAHPCNHGFYASQAAHAKKGGHFTRTVARSDLGKDGDCTQPLPTPVTSTSSGQHDSEAGDNQSGSGSGGGPESESDSD